MGSDGRSLTAPSVPSLSTPFPLITVPSGGARPLRGDTGRNEMGRSVEVVGSPLTFLVPSARPASLPLSRAPPYGRFPIRRKEVSGTGRSEKGPGRSLPCRSLVSLSVRYAGRDWKERPPRYAFLLPSHRRASFLWPDEASGRYVKGKGVAWRDKW